jgi:iron complex outermembrane receptor protein
VRVGARFDDYDQELKNRRNNTVSKYSTTEVSPQFGVVYKLTDAVSVYAAYGENFRPLSGATSENDLEPNESTSKEVGINFVLNDGAIQGNLALFDVEQSNISTVDDAFNATAIGKAGSQGVELDLYGNLTDTLSLWFSYAYVDAETENDFNDPNFGTVVPEGSDLLNIPDHQLSMQLVKQTQLAGKNLQLIGGLLHVGERNGFFSDQSFKLPSYTTVRVAATYQVSPSLALQAEINNVFDKEYYTNSFADVWVQPGAPRNGSVSAVYKF